MLDWTAIAIILSNLGALAIVGKWIISGVSKSNENISVMLKSIQTLTEGVKELFDSRNDHALQLKEIETGIEYCDACNTHKHRRIGDNRTTLTQTRRKN